MVTKKVNVVAYEGKKKRLPNGRWYEFFVFTLIFYIHVYYLSCLLFLIIFATRYKEPTYKKFIVWFDKAAKAPAKDPSLVLTDEYLASQLSKTSISSTAKTE